MLLLVQREDRRKIMMNISRNELLYTVHYSQNANTEDKVGGGSKGLDSKKTVELFGCLA